MPDEPRPAANGSSYGPWRLAPPPSPQRAPYPALDRQWRDETVPGFFRPPPLQFIDVRMQRTEFRNSREEHWEQTRRQNLDAYRNNEIAMLQIDSRQEVWGVRMRCDTSWERIRSLDIAPRYTLIWDNNFSEFVLVCTQEPGSHFLLSQEI